MIAGLLAVDSLSAMITQSEGITRHALSALVTPFCVQILSAKIPLAKGALQSFANKHMVVGN